MSWEYNQQTGVISWNGDYKGIGYSGYPPNVNNPLAQNIEDSGPIPKGSYTICYIGDTPLHGPYVLQLSPARDNTMFGRSGFLMHSDSLSHPGFASKGCIICLLSLRQVIWGSKDVELIVS